MLGHALEELIDLVARGVRRDVNLNTASVFMRSGHEFVVHPNDGGQLY